MEQNFEIVEVIIQLRAIRELLEQAAQRDMKREAKSEPPFHGMVNTTMPFPR